MVTVSGKVERPGNYEIAMGTPFREVIEELAGGMLGGGALKAWTPGGSSTPMLTAGHIDCGWTTSRSPRPGRCSAPRR